VGLRQLRLRLSDAVIAFAIPVGVLFVLGVIFAGGSNPVLGRFYLWSALVAAAVACRVCGVARPWRVQPDVAVFVAAACALSVSGSSVASILVVVPAVVCEQLFWLKVNRAWNNAWNGGALLGQAAAFGVVSASGGYDDASWLLVALTPVLAALAFFVVIHFIALLRLASSRRLSIALVAGATRAAVVSAVLSACAAIGILVGFRLGGWQAAALVVVMLLVCSSRFPSGLRSTHPRMRNRRRPLRRIEGLTRHIPALVMTAGATSCILLAPADGELVWPLYVLGATSFVVVVAAVRGQPVPGVVQRPLAVRLLASSLAAAALSATAWLGSTRPIAPATTILLLSAMAALAETASVFFDDETSLSGSFVIVLGAVAVLEPHASLVGPLFVGMAAAFYVPHIRAKDWDKVCFHLGSYGLAALASSAAAAAVGGNARAPLSLVLLSGLVAASVFWIVNNLAVAILLSRLAGVSARHELRRLLLAERTFVVVGAFGYLAGHIWATVDGLLGALLLVLLSTLPCLTLGARRLAPERDRASLHTTIEPVPDMRVDAGLLSQVIRHARAEHARSERDAKE